jgi:hypothetical protein
MASTVASQDRFDLGRVLQHAFGAIRHNASSFAILALLLAGAPALISTLGAAGLMSRFLGVPGVHAYGPSGLLFTSGGLLGLITNAVLQGAIIYGSACYLNGRAASLGDCFGAGVRRCLPLIGLMLVAVVALMIGFVLFVVPGIMMAVAWIVAAPALVVERTGVFGAFSRSADLTRGRRWSIFGLLFLYLVAATVVQGVAQNLVGALSFAANPVAMMLNQLPVSAALGVVVSVINSAGIAAVYYELRATREGVGPEALAAVFD